MSDTNPPTLWRHKKRGTVYTEVCRAHLQTAQRSSLDDLSILVVYRGENGQMWAREESEFEDGRFDPVK